MEEDEHQRLGWKLLDASAHPPPSLRLGYITWTRAPRQKAQTHRDSMPHARAVPLPSRSLFTLQLQDSRAPPRAADDGITSLVVRAGPEQLAPSPQAGKVSAAPLFPFSPFQPRAALADEAERARSRVRLTERSITFENLVSCSFAFFIFFLLPFFFFFFSSGFFGGAGLIFLFLFL